MTRKVAMAINGRARRTVLGLTVASVVLAGCSAAPVTVGGSAAPGAPVVSAETAAPSDREVYIAEGPAPLNPAVFEHGSFVGAIDLEYRGERTSDTAKSADAKYAEYFKGQYSPPEPGERNVIRLNAMGDPRDGGRLLFKGAIIDNITLPHEIVLGLHNITRIEGGVELNGESFEGRVAGANGTMVIGDRMTVWVQDPYYSDLVDRYVYEVIESETGGDYTLVDVGPGFEDIIYRASPSEDVYQLSLYTCWPPNQSIRRLVTRLQLVESSVDVGSIKPIDA